MKKLLFLVYLAIILIPVIINYGLFTWRAPFVYGNSDSWLSFFASYIGIIAAITIAILQFKIQKDRDIELERESHRSYMIAQEFRAPFGLSNIITKENSKIIVNEYYNQAEAYFNYSFDTDNKGCNSLREYLEKINIQYYKFTHSGIPELIIDCHFNLVIADASNYYNKYTITSNIGTIEKAEEIFIPIINMKYKEITPLEVEVTYKTIKGEQMKYTYDYKEKQESHMVNNKGVYEVLFVLDLTESTWIYPSKIKR